MRHWIAVTFAACMLFLSCAKPNDPFMEDDGGTGTGTDGGTCAADLMKDPQNCGACGNACAMKQVCSKGTCANQCLSPMLQCGMTCVDPMTDHDNCGACNKPCGVDQDCVGKTCVKKCPMGQSSCDNMTCTNLQTDVNNCGTCNTACNMGEVCTTGMCCMMGQVACNKTCTDTQNDAMNCGMCGFACTGMTPYCAKGTCVATKGMKCADFKNNGNNYQQFCWTLANNTTVCIGETSGANCTCTDTNTGIHFVFDYAKTYPMRFTANTATCQNYHPTYLQNLATALKYTKFTVNQTKTGNSCTRTYLDANLNFQSTTGDSTQAQVYDINFDN